MTLFPFIEDGHPFHDQVEGFRESVATRGHGSVTAGAVISSEVRGRPDGDGGFVLDRFYCSVQSWPEDGPAFAADSLYFAAKDGTARWYSFPDEPYLSALGGYLAARGLRSAADGLRVLRYVPLRRFTFLAPRRDGAPGREVAKFKRRSRLAESYERMVAVATAVAGTAPGFAVPAPGGTDADASIYFQDGAPGTDLATLAGRDPAALPRAAEVLAAFHAVPAAGIPDVDAAAFLAGVARDLDWVAFHAPALRDLVDAARTALRSAPPIEAAVTCHGDFVPSHVLDDAGSLTVIDLDLAHRGDPHREVAMLLASLPTDAPGVPADEDAIVAAYAERARSALDPRRLAWHRAAAELYYLALAFSKDRPVDAAPLRRAVEHLAAT